MSKFTKKNVWLFYSIDLKKKDLKIFEQKVDKEILCQNRDLTQVEICKISKRKSNFISFITVNLLKRKSPYIVVFYECNNTDIKIVSEAIKRLINKDFLVVYKEKNGEENICTFGTKINTLYDVARFLVSVN